MENIDIYFFSGTGNTLLVVEKMAKTFRENNIKTNLFKIEDSNPKDINLNHTIGIAFPVAELSTYQFVWDFVKAIPKTQGTPIFMVDTLGGFSGGIVGPMKKIISKKGYNPIGAKEIIMPVNIFYIQDPETNQEKINKGLEQAEQYALELLHGKAKWGRTPLISDAIYYTSLAGLKITHSNINQKYFPIKFEQTKCNKCGLCVELCPIKNLNPGDDEYPENKMECSYCLRCVGFCPNGALISPFNYKGRSYRAVKANKFLDFKKTNIQGNP